MEPQIYTLAEIKNGTGWKKGARFIVYTPSHAAAPEMVAGLQNILEWAESRDGSPEADDTALRTIATDARTLLAKIKGQKRSK